MEKQIEIKINENEYFLLTLWEVRNSIYMLSYVYPHEYEEPELQDFHIANDIFMTDTYDKCMEKVNYLLEHPEELIYCKLTGD